MYIFFSYITIDLYQDLKFSRYMYVLTLILMCLVSDLRALVASCCDNSVANMWLLTLYGGEFNFFIPLFSVRQLFGIAYSMCVGFYFCHEVA